MIVAVLAVNALAVLLLTPDYAGWAVTMLEGYGAFNLPLLRLIVSSELVIVLIAALAWGFGRLAGIDAGVNLRLPVVVLALYGAGLAQMKGWGYHFIPAALLAGWYLVYSLLHLFRRYSILGRLAVPALLAVLTLSFIDAALTLQESATTQQLSELMRRHSPKQDVYYPAELEMQPVWSALVECGCHWPVRYVNLLCLREEYVGGPPTPHAPARMSDRERHLFDAVRADLLAHPPRLLIFAEGDVFDFRTYFAGDADLAGLLKQYRPLARVPNSSHASEAESYLVLKRGDS